VLSDRPPFCQAPNDGKAAIKIVNGDQPARPGRDKHGGSEIDDRIWTVFLACWAYEAKDRATTLRIQEDFRHIRVEGLRAKEQPMNDVNVLKTSLDDLDLTKDALTKVLGADRLCSARVPEHLSTILSHLVRDRWALRDALRAALKLTRDDVQVFVDFLESVSL